MANPTFDLFTGKCNPPIEVSSLPPVEISSLPPVEISTLPPVVIEELPCLEVCSLPDVVIAEVPDLVVKELPVIEIAKHVVDTHEVCGELWYIWSDGTKTTEALPVCPEPVVYCPSLRIACAGGVPGFGFHEADPPDPAATVVMEPCDGDTSVDPIYIYPTAGPGHTVRVNNDDGTLVGYAVNKSDCAPDCGCPDPVINIKNNFNPTTNVTAPAVVNNFKPTTNVAAPEVTTILPAPTLVANTFNNEGVLTSTLSDGTTVASNPLPSC